MLGPLWCCFCSSSCCWAWSWLRNRLILRRYQWIAGILLGVLLLFGIVWALIPAQAEPVRRWCPSTMSAPSAPPC